VQPILDARRMHCGHIAAERMQAMCTVDTSLWEKNHREGVNKGLHEFLHHIAAVFGAAI
jgi:hypothetical protein